MDFKLPTCPYMFNIFHPYDPVAYRLEPLFDPSFDQKEPFLGEAADLLYYYLVLLTAKGFSLDDVIAVLKERH